MPCVSRTSESLRLPPIPGLLLTTCFLTAFFSATLRTDALQFEVKQLSDESVISRDPVIGDASMIAWISAYTNEVIGMRTALTTINKGERRDVMNPDGGGESLKPVASSTSLVWIGTYSNIRGTISARLQEVPWRDEGGAKEMRALYSALPDGKGNATLVLVPTNEQFRTVLITNELGVVNVTNIAESVDITNEIRRHPSGPQEIVFFNGGTNAQRITHDNRNDIAPSLSEGQVVWQKSKGWPFGWEIFYWKDGVSKQLTTNFYYDMAPKIHGSQMTWYGWDGRDFEIFHFDVATEKITTLTSNRYDDVGPVIWNGDIAWEGYLSAEADIYLYHSAADTNGQMAKTIRKISDNLEDDINPRIWNGQVVWQGFDGDDFEIYYFDGQRTRKLTANNYDDTNPDIRDGVITWQGYKDNWDAEIFAWQIPASPIGDNAIDPKTIVQVTENEEEDRDPRTSGSHIVWQQDTGGRSRILLATPK